MVCHQARSGVAAFADRAAAFDSALVVAISGCCVAGGLNYQIEHHLFPTLPRHNLAKVRAAVEELCRKHGLAYESCGMAAGTVKVLKHLADIASQA